MTVPESFQSRSFRFSLELLRFYRVAANTDVPRHFLHQGLRAGTAVGAHLEEARSAYSRRDLASKYTIALREACECHYWLRLVRADQPPLTEEVNMLLREVDQLIAVLTTSVKKLRTTVLANAATNAVLLLAILASLLLYGL